MTAPTAEQRAAMIYGAIIEAEKDMNERGHAPTSGPQRIIADAIRQAEAAAYERAAQVADAERTASGGIIATAIRRLAEPRAMTGRAEEVMR